MAPRVLSNSAVAGAHERQRAGRSIGVATHAIMTSDNPERSFRDAAISSSHAESRRPTARAALGALRRALRTALDRALHPSRQRAARERLRQLGSPERVLFVCHGNIYRSPYAEAAFRHQLPAHVRDRFLVASAGFVGPGRPAPPESVALAAENGLDLSAHRSQLVTPALVKEADLVVVMNAEQEREICRRFGYSRRRVLILGDLDTDPIETRDIADPWNRPVDVLHASAARVTRCTRELAGEVLGGDGGRTRELPDGLP